MISFFKKFRKPKLIIKGKCKKCGNCCRNITFLVGDRYITDEREFENMKKLDKGYNNFFVSGKDENGILLFTCKALGEDNLCKTYYFRSLYCWLYPRLTRKDRQVNIQMLDGCGYYTESNIDFEDYLTGKVE